MELEFGLSVVAASCMFYAWGCEDDSEDSTAAAENSTKEEVEELRERMRSIHAFQRDSEHYTSYLAFNQYLLGKFILWVEVGVCICAFFVLLLLHI